MNNPIREVEPAATLAQHGEESTHAPLQPWTKPGFERMPLKDALSLPSGVGGDLTYPGAAS